MRIFSCIICFFDIAAVPQYTGAVAIEQYVYSDSATAELECPLDFGRLHEFMPSYYHFSWVERNDSRQSPIISDDTYQLSSRDRLLQVRLPLPTASYSFQCNGRVRRCNATVPPESVLCGESVVQDPPFISVEFVGEYYL